MNGRALAQNGDVTLINDAITLSTCAAPTATASPALGPTVTVPPTDAPATSGGQRSDQIPFVIGVAFVVALLIVAGRSSLLPIRRR
jgi:hypothetical protein